MNQFIPIIKEAKQNSSLWLKTKTAELNTVGWQDGYNLFSIGFSQIEVVRKYITRQQDHHRKGSFQDQLGDFLRRHEIEFDGRYIWD